MTLKTREEIKLWLNSMNIKNYTINEDLIVDVKGNVELNNHNLVEIPVQFGIVEGSFDCAFNQLINLKGSPVYVKKYFFCSSNKLTNLEGAPESVDYFLAENNELISTKGIPKHIGKICNLSSNPIKHVDYLPTTIVGNFYFDNKKGLLEDFKDLYEINNGIKELRISFEKLHSAQLYHNIHNKLEDKTFKKARGKI